MTRRLPGQGDRISEYVLEERLGCGGFGEVWKAAHAFLPDEVAAIKIPTDSGFIDNLRREGAILHALRGKHIVEIKGLDPFADPPYLVMEYVAGKSLRQLLSESKHLSAGDALDMFRQSLLALQTAHRQGVIHRDVKPENILIDPKGVVKLTDFGLGRAVEAAASGILQSGDLRTAASGVVAGTLRYMSPEQREGADVDARTDLYSLGMVLFEMVTGEPPQGAEVPSDLRDDLPDWVDRVFSRCYTRRERRYANAAEALEDLPAPPRPATEEDIVFLDEVKTAPPPPAPVVPPAPVREPRPVWMLPFLGIHALFEGFTDGVRQGVKNLRDGGGAAGVTVFFLSLLAAVGLVFLASRGGGTDEIPSPVRTQTDWAKTHSRLRAAHKQKNWNQVWTGLSNRARMELAEVAGYDLAHHDWRREGSRLLVLLMENFPENDPPGVLKGLRLSSSSGPRSVERLSSRRLRSVETNVATEWVREGGAWKLDRAYPPGRSAAPVRKSLSAWKD
jgi:serine/threonine protein kinase